MTTIVSDAVDTANTSSSSTTTTTMDNLTIPNDFTSHNNNNNTNNCSNIVVVDDDDTNDNWIDITSLIHDCAIHHLSVQEPFIWYDGNNNNNNNNNNNSTATTTISTNAVVIVADADIDHNHHYHHSLSQQQEQHQQTPNRYATTTTTPITTTKSSEMEFNLQDAMAATQLMDPKMDCCQIPISYYQSQQKKQKQQQQEMITNNNNNEVIERMIYPRPIPTKLNDPMVGSLPWYDDTTAKTIDSSTNTATTSTSTPNNNNDIIPLTIEVVTIIGIELLIRYQSLLCGSSIGESIFTCYYTHYNILQDMHQQLLLLHHHHNNNVIIEESKLDVNESIKNMSLNDTTLNGNHITASTSTTPTTTINTVLQYTLFAMSYAIVDITEMVREIILNADIYEEEDFAIHTHNILFYPSSISSSTTSNNNNSSRNSTDNPTEYHDLDDSDTFMDSISIIETALHHIDQISTRATTATTISLSESEQGYIIILQNILEYEMNMLRIIPRIARLGSGIQLRTTLQTIQGLIDSAIYNIDTIQGHVVKYICQNNSNDNNNNSNNTVENVYNKPIIQQAIQRCFDSYVIRPLVGNIPIRKISFQLPYQSLDIIRTITKELNTNICSVLLHSTSLSRIYYMLDTLCYCNILCRSILLLNLYFDEKVFGQYDLRDLVSYDIQQQFQINNTNTTISSSSSSLLYNEQQFTDDTIVFLNRLAKPIYDTMKVRFLNRHRQRTYIEMIMLPEWINLQNEAQLFDVHCNETHIHHRNDPNSDNINVESLSSSSTTTYFTRYVLMMQIRLMDRYVEAGIEVGLFRNIIHDISFAYWYRDYLLSALHLQLSTTTNTTSSSSSPVESNNNHSSNNSKESKSKLGSKKKNHVTNNRNGKSNHQQQIESPTGGTTNSRLQQLLPEERERRNEMMIISLKRHLCRKMIQYISLLRKVGIIQDEVYEFTSYEQIFMKRFDIFTCIQQPVPLSYDDYIIGIDASSISTLDLIKVICDGYTNCRTMIDNIIHDMIDIDPLYCTMSTTELRSLMKVCIGNTVYIQRVKQLYEKYYVITNTNSTNTNINNNNNIHINMKRNVKLTFDYDSHAQFCIIKVEEQIVNI